MTCNKVDVADTNVNPIMNGQAKHESATTKKSSGTTRKTTLKRLGPVIWEDVIVVTVVMVVCFEVYLAAFDSTNDAVWAVVFVCDVLYFINMILMFFLPFQDKGGLWISDHKEISRHYLITQFPVDLLSLLPIELAALLLPSSDLWMNISFFRLNRLLRVYKISTFFGRREDDLDRSTVKTRGFKYFVLCVLTTHLTTCGWYGLACDGKHEHKNRTCQAERWASTFDLGFQMTEANVLDNYVVSLYWAVATVTSTGYGDISANTITEKWYSIFAMLLGIGVFFGMLLGGMTSLLSNFDAHRANFVHRFQSIKSFMKDLEVDPALQSRVNSYYEYLWKQKNGVTSQGIYKKLPMTFQAEISHATNRDIIAKAPIFKDLDHGFLRKLSLSIKQVLYLPTQIVVKRGDIGREMFFIMHGEIEIMSEDDDELPIAVLKSGSIFGEMSMVISLPRTASARAKTHCDVLMIEKHDLHEVLHHFPQVAEKLHLEVKKRFAAIPAILGAREKRTAPSSLNQPTWLRKASFLPSKDDLSSFSDAHMKKKLTTTIDEVQSNLQFDLEKLRAKHKSESNWSWSTLCNLIWTGTIKQSSTFISVWNLIIVAVTILQSIITSYMAAFTSYGERKGYFDTTPGLILLVISYLLDLAFIIDIWITFRKEVPGQYSSISDKKIICKMYVKSIKFWIDLCSILPLEILCYAVTGRKERHRLYGFLRLNRIIKVIKVQGLFSAMESMLHVSISVIRAVKLILYIILLSHWSACAMFLMICSGETCKSPSWLTNRNETVPVVTPTSEYITSVYWAAATMTSTGYGDISATTTLGRVISLCIMIIGLLLYGYSLALMAATLANADSPRVRFQEKLFAVQKFMKEHHLNIDLQHQVVAYMGLLWDKYRGDWMPGQKPLIYDAPSILQKDITYEDACKTIAKVPLFLHTDDNFLRSLALKLQTYLYNPGDVIIYCRDVGREMYCIRKGWCQVQTESGRTLSHIGPESYIGEIGLLFGDTRSATVRALTHCELVMLTLDDMQIVLKDYPIIKEQFDSIEERKEQLMELKEHFAKLMLQELKPEDSEDKLKTPSSSKASFKKSSMKMFGKAKTSANAEYIEPFRRLNPVVRLFSHLLMRRTFLNNGPMLKWWTVLMTVVAVIVAFTVMLQASFIHQNAFFWAINYTLDLVSWINMYISFHIAFYNDKQILITHPLSTASNYLRTNFLIDILSCFPIEVFAYAAYPHLDYDGLYMLSLFRLNRLIQIHRLPMLFTYFESSVDKETGTIREIKFGFYSLIFMNWLTCVFFILACPSKLLGNHSDYVTLSCGHRCLKESWLVNSKIDIMSSGIGKAIVKCLYWAAATSVSVGYGDISAYTNAEMVISLIAMVSGVIFFGYIIASVAASLANADAQRARFQEKLSSIEQYIKGEKLESGLQKRILKYYDYLWLRTRGVEPDSLLNVLPLSLWGDVTLDLYRATLEGIELFKDTETSFLKMLSRCITPVLFLKGEYVVRKFDMGEQMFFIQRGAVDVVSEDGQIVFATMHKGNSFGEVALLFSVPRTASIRAGTNVDMFCLSKGDLDNVLSLYPVIREKVLSIADERREQARKRSAAKANEQKVKSKASLLKASKMSNKGASSTKMVKASSGTVASQPASAVTSMVQTPVEEEVISDSPSSPESGVETPDYTKMLDTDFDDVLPESGDEEENENQNNANNCNQNNTASYSDPDFGEFTSLEDWDMLALGEMFAAGDAHGLNRNVNNALIGSNRNRNNDNKNETEQDKEVKPPKCSAFRRLAEFNRFTIRPSSKKLKAFDSFMCVIAFISIWMMTYEAAFQDHHLALVVVNYVIDVLFFVKIYVYFHTSFYDEYGELTDDFEAVYKNYLKSPDGFALEVVTAFPLDIFALAAPSGKKMLALSYLRLIHCLRIIRVSSYFSNWEKGLNINMLAARLSKFFVGLFLLIHFLSCIWYSLACPLAECDTNTWVALQESIMTSHMNSYCVCVYWAVATMTSTGYGDVYATNVKEMIYASVVMVVGKLMFGFILGNIASTLSNAEIQKVQYQEQLEVMKNAMTSEGVPSDVEHHVVLYMINLWYRNKGVDSHSLFKDAPDCLLAELLRTITFDMFEAIPLLHGCDESFLRALALNVQQHVYIPGNYIMRKGDVGQEVYYVHKGQVEVHSDDGEVSILKQGEIFGEVSLLCAMMRQVTVIAKTHTDLLVLTMHDLENVLKSYPTVASQVHNVGYQRFKDILGHDYLHRKSQF